MKRFINWLKPGSQKRFAADKDDQGNVGVKSEQTTPGEHSDNSYFSWFGIDHADSSIFDTGSLAIEKSEDRNAVTHKTPNPEGDSLCSPEADVGVDPYNTGSFDIENN